MLGKLGRWAVVVGVLFAVSNLGYYGYATVFVEGYGSDLAGLSGGNISVVPGSASCSASPTSRAAISGRRSTERRRPRPVGWTPSSPSATWTS